MTEGDRGWTALISVQFSDPEHAGWLERALRPEATRDVPRANAEIRRPAPDRVEVSLQARDTGSVRAAMNSYLGWVHLALATLGRSRPVGADRSAPPR